MDDDSGDSEEVKKIDLDKVDDMSVKGIFSCAACKYDYLKS